ncbi:MAG: hypothetical protein V3V44_02295, partial [Anaerolineales bacterium]
MAMGKYHYHATRLSHTVTPLYNLFRIVVFQPINQVPQQDPLKTLRRIVQVLPHLVGGGTTASSLNQMEEHVADAEPLDATGKEVDIV